MADDGLLRIGALSRRSGVRPDRLRAWERRYGLLKPVRTPGGFRLYSAEDARRIRDMQGHLERGLSAAEAARAVLDADGAPVPQRTLEEERRRLTDALAAYDDAGAHTVLDRLFAVHGAEVALRDVVYPYLRALGEAWESGEATVGQEHFASNLIQGRLLALEPGWDRGNGPRALLACPSGEHHCLGLAGFGVALRRRGWRVTYLGADTPIANVARAAVALEPELVVLAATMAHPLALLEDELRELAAFTRLLVGGAGAGGALADRVGAEYVDLDPVTAAERLTAA